MENFNASLKDDAMEVKDDAVSSLVVRMSNMNSA